MLLICCSNTSAIQSPYIDVYTMVYDGDFIAIRISNNSITEVNPLVIVYTNQQVQVYRNEEKITNQTNKISIEVKSFDKIEVISENLYFTFTAQTVTNQSLIDLEPMYPISYLETAFNVGFTEAMISVFIVSPIIAIIWRKNSL